MASEDSEKEIASLRAQIRKLQKNNLGLVFEDKKEDVVEQSKYKVPVLKEVKKNRINLDDSNPNNLLIEGDNYLALSVLNYTHKKNIDLIYIDPPYNTGAKNWKYNNDYVDKDDEYRHSKWLSFMRHRLKLAKNLLRDDGVLICAIDENEQAHLGVLIEQLFPAHEQHTITVIHNPKGVQGTNFSYTHEYAIFVVPKSRKSVGDRALTPMAQITTNPQGGPELGGVRRYFQPSFVLDRVKIKSDSGAGKVRTHDGFLMRDAGLFGMSGGPVFGKEGRVVGMQGSVTKRDSVNANRTITVENAIAIQMGPVIELLKKNRIKFNLMGKI